MTEDDTTTGGAPKGGLPARLPGAPGGGPPRAVAGGPGADAPGVDAGMATAEYAVATLAAVAFAGLLLTVLGSGEVQGLLLELVRRALGSV